MTVTCRAWRLLCRISGCSFQPYAEDALTRLLALGFLRTYEQQALGYLLSLQGGGRATLPGDELGVV